ncbi:bidirectional sugar transporter SWEET4 [Amaranthus tricolor]|uniref:bidirectional sugar transporter SWEET4 n=1 Tax=Amaranthus tricolor TaxID=29722 RepID=UPI00259069D7|nr:bidirectional sugar transporter SWEET4 [Amaranthus tricolor]
MKHSLIITRNVIGAIGNVISVFLFTSPMPTFIEIYKKKRVEEYKADPYLATTMNCMLWVFYGMPFVHPHSPLVLSTNAIGLTIELLYIITFFIYADYNNRMKVIRWIAVEFIFMGIVVLVTMLCFQTTQRRSLFVGILCVIFCLGMYVSPLTVMGKVIKTKSVTYMPFWLSVGSLANGIIWTIYAFLPLDQWILIPNGLGTLSGATQLILYACYYKSTPKQDDDEKKPNQVQLSFNGKSLA